MFHLFQKVRVGAIFVLVVVLSILFTALAFPRFERVPWYRQLIMTVVIPPQKTVTGISEFVSGVWNHYIAITEAAKENESLRAKIDEAGRKLIELSAVRDENARMRQLLEMSQEIKLSGVGAHVVASNPMSEFKTVTIDKGHNHGINKNMAVISHGGLVGKVAQVSKDESVVLLISDPNSSVDVFAERSGARAILTGHSYRLGLKPFFSLSRLEYLRRTSDVREEDIVMTSGLDRLYPPNVPVGTVHEVVSDPAKLFQDAKVVPFVDFSEMREVLVLK